MTFVETMDAAIERNRRRQVELHAAYAAYRERAEQQLHHPACPVMFYQIHTYQSWLHHGMPTGIPTQEDSND